MTFKEEWYGIEAIAFDALCYFENGIVKTFELKEDTDDKPIS